MNGGREPFLSRRRTPVVKPAGAAGQSRGCAASGCSKEIPLSHRFCTRHHDLLTPDQRRNLDSLIRAVQHTPGAHSLNRLNDFTRDLAEHIRTAGG